MYSTSFKTFALAAALAARSVLADLVVLTPTLVQCENTTVKFSGGNPNYQVSIVPSNDPCSDSLLDIPQTSATSVTFLVDIIAGTTVDVVVDSADGQEGWSATTTVQAGKDSSCLSKAVSASSSKSSSSSSSVSTVHASSVSAASSAVPASSSTANPSAAVPSAAPPPAVQSGTIGSGSGSPDSPVNVGSDPNSNSSGASGAVPRMTLSVGTLMASVLFAFAVSQL